MQGRVQKILSAHGVASRRASEELIAGGRVTVNGCAATLGDCADDEKDIIKVDGKSLSQLEPPVYIMLNKPSGYITTVRDEHGRDTVIKLISGVNGGVYPVGRLDMDSEGLLLMTNDGQFANSVMHPSFGISKVYEAHVTGNIDDGVRMLREPVEIDARPVRAISVIIKRQSGGTAVLLIEIIEGRNRQVRKMCAKCGLSVVLLKRISIGSLELGSLEPGKWRRLTDDEVAMLTAHDKRNNERL